MGLPIVEPVPCDVIDHQFFWEIHEVPVHGECPSHNFVPELSVPLGCQLRFKIGLGFQLVGVHGTSLLPRHVRNLGIELGVHGFH